MAYLGAYFLLTCGVGGFQNCFQKQGSELLGNAQESLGQENGPRQDRRMTGFVVIEFRCGPKSESCSRISATLVCKNI